MKWKYIIFMKLLKFFFAYAKKKKLEMLRKKEKKT